MKFIECQQGTDEWYTSRAGRVTASNFRDAISVCSRASGRRKAGDMSAAAEEYAATVAIERIFGKPVGEPVKAWVLERGHELEGIARMKYEARDGAYVTEAGICVTDDGIFGYSTDGLVNDDGLIEIKCPVNSAKVLNMWMTGDVSEYIDQMQGGMWITGRKWCDFIMYSPALASVGKDLYVKRIARDEEYIDSMVNQLARFVAKVDEFESVLRAPLPKVAA
jgi:hypothetical protein